MSTKLGLLAIAATVSLFSCAPKDEKLLKPGSGGGVTQLNEPTAEDGAKLLFLPIDRQVEALHYLKLALNAEYAKSKAIAFEDITVGERKITIGADKLDTGDYLQAVPANLVAKVTLSDDKTIVKSVVIQDSANGKGVQELFQKKDNKSILSVKNYQKQISVLKSDKEEGMYNIEIFAIEETNAMVGGQSLSKTSAKFRIAWDGKVESLGGDIKIVFADLENIKYGVTKYSARSTESSLTVNLEGGCASANGSITLVNSKPKKGQAADAFKFTLTDSSIAVEGKKASFQSAACASRPTVDIRKLL